MSDMGEGSSMEMNPAQGGGNGDMPGGDMERPNGNTLPLDARIERSVGQFVDQIVDRALAEVSSKQERGLVRQALADELRSTLYQLAEQESQRRMAVLATNGQNGGAMAIGDAVGVGINALKEVQNL